MSPDNKMPQVMLLTNHYKVIGNINLLPGVRLTDYMNESKDFIAVTGAVVFDRASGERILSDSFINVQRNSIEVIIPETEP